MKPKLARILRKWADFIDPRPRNNELVVSLRCDASEFTQQINEAKLQIEALLDLSTKANLKVGGELA